MFDVVKMHRGKTTCVIEKSTDFIMGTVDAAFLPTVSGHEGFVKESIKLTTNVPNADSSAFTCGFSTFKFDMSNVLAAEFTVEAIKGLNGYYNMDVSFVDDSNNSIRLYTDDMTGSTTRISTSITGGTSSDTVLIDKHNISGNPDCYYNFTIRIDKQAGQVMLLHNGQMFGYTSVESLNSFGKGEFKLTIQNATTGGKSVSIRQIKVRLEY